MNPTESIHRYPRTLTFVLELISAAAVVVTLVQLGLAVLRGVWAILGTNLDRVANIPVLGQLVQLIKEGTQTQPTGVMPFLIGLLPALGWTAGALLLAIVLRNAFPTVRASGQGLLVEFANGWLPINWERIQGLSVTEDLAGERFVVLAQVAKPNLTSWHRLYSFIYRFGWKRGFLISSRISGFDTLVQMMLTESEKAARAFDNVQPVKLNEQARSPLFRLLLSPGAFFSRRTVDEGATTAAPTAQPIPSGPVSGSYPARIAGLIGGVVALIAALALLRYAIYWIQFIALVLPSVRATPPFSWLTNTRAFQELFGAFRTSGVPIMGVAGYPALPQPWWLLVAAHLTLLLIFPLLIALRNLLPSLQARDDGLAVRDMFSGRWRLLPWQSVAAVKATEISEQSQVLLVQSRGRTAGAGNRLSGLLYDGALRPGVLITSAVGNFADIVSRIVSAVQPLEQPEQPILQQEAHAWPIWLAARPGPALTTLVEQARDEPATRNVEPKGLLASATPLLIVTLLPALMVLLSALLLRGSPPGLGILGGVIGIWLLGLLEWPLAAIVSVVLDNQSGGGEEGYRALYLYPMSQMPRAFALAGALVATVLGLPILPALFWLGAIVWSFFLARQLWIALYDWDTTQALLGAVVPVIWQLLIMLVFLLTQR